MRIQVRLPKVIPNAYDEPKECPKEGCDGRHFKPHSLKGEKKAARDLWYQDDLDGTNNSSERLIGWWIKERYRTMRGYKRPKSVKNVVTLTARMGARSGRYDMTELYM